MPDDDLDGLRIQRIALLRRGLYRSRSYCLIGAAVCLVASIQLISNAVRQVRVAGWNWVGAAYVAIAAVCLMLAVPLILKMIHFHREAVRCVLPEPPKPPDFGPLSDGSQRWKNLEDLG